MTTRFFCRQNSISVCCVAVTSMQYPDYDNIPIMTIDFTILDFYLTQVEVFVYFICLCILIYDAFCSTICNCC